MTITLQINDIEIKELAAAFDALDMERVVERVVPVAGKMVQTRMAVYPPETEANAPKPETGARWYQRQWGPRWRLASGEIGGRNTSERLQKAWRTKRINHLKAQVLTESSRGGEVSYVEHVQSYEEQTAVHREHGWQTDKKVAEDVEKSRALDKYISLVIARELKQKLGV